MEVKLLTIEFDIQKLVSFLIWNALISEIWKITWIGQSLKNIEILPLEEFSVKSSILKKCKKKSLNLSNINEMLWKTAYKKVKGGK